MRGWNSSSSVLNWSVGPILASRLDLLIYSTCRIVPQRKLPCSELEGSLAILGALTDHWLGGLSLIIQEWNCCLYLRANL